MGGKVGPFEENHSPLSSLLKKKENSRWIFQRNPLKEKRKTPGGGKGKNWEMDFGEKGKGGFWTAKKGDAEEKIRAILSSEPANWAKKRTLAAIP